MPQPLVRAFGIREVEETLFVVPCAGRVALFEPARTQPQRPSRARDPSAVSCCHRRVALPDAMGLLFLGPELRQRQADDCLQGGGVPRSHLAQVLFPARNEFQREDAALAAVSMLRLTCSLTSGGRVKHHQSTAVFVRSSNVFMISATSQMPALHI